MSDTDVVRELTIAGTPAPVSVLPVAGIFGANASGKSTILRAMADMLDPAEFREAADPNRS